ncbi:MAG: radical SAM protein [Deltaproteobacteria bacterium]|nr:radical SAM protein [Deltaproteobacteria bacterium]
MINNILFDSRRSHWFVELLSFYFRRKILGQAIPLLASFKVTYRCNLRCRGCPFHLRMNEENSHMTWERATEALQKLKNTGARIVIFEGGEPLLWRDGDHDISDLVLSAKKLFMRVAVTTNGTFPLNVPADVIWVSLDGLKETHDLLRDGSFDLAWNNLKTAEHPKVFVHFTMNRKNWRDLEMLVEQLADIPAVKGLTLQLFYPYGQGEEALALSPEDRKQALEAAISLKRSGYPVLNSKRRLRAMIENNWTCHDDILVNVDPDGTVTAGCYVKNRGKINCKDCGFTPVAEASGALDMLPGSIVAGWRLYVA